MTAEQPEHDAPSPSAGDALSAEAAARLADEIAANPSHPLRPLADAAAAAPTNGHGAASQPSIAQQTANNTAATAVMLQQLPQALAQLLGPLLAQLRPLHCAHCLSARINWENGHAAEIRQALADARHAAGVPDEVPLPPQFDVSPFFPPRMRPGGPEAMPQVNPKATTVGGTDVCNQHIPGVTGSKQPLLIARGSLTPSMLQQLGG